MPTYQYECSHCEHAFEELQTMLDKKLRKCPECGKNALDRLIGSGSGIVFKGSGFYETDYKNKSEPKSEPKNEPKSDSPNVKQGAKPCCKGEKACSAAA